jgi:hypothetical protein
MDQSDEALTYPYAVTMNEVLEIVIEHIDKVMDTDDLVKQKIHLNLAVTALKCACQIYGSQLATPTEKAK